MDSFHFLSLSPLLGTQPPCCEEACSARGEGLVEKKLMWKGTESSPPSPRPQPRLSSQPTASPPCWPCKWAILEMGPPVPVKPPQLTWWSRGQLSLLNPDQTAGVWAKSMIVLSSTKFWHGLWSSNNNRSISWIKGVVTGWVFRAQDNSSICHRSTLTYSTSWRWAIFSNSEVLIVER